MKKYYLFFLGLCFAIVMLVPSHAHSGNTVRSRPASSYFITSDSDSISVPNIITPNGDGINDYLTIYCRGVNTFLIYIYDRFGQLVFTTSYPAIAWDGRTNAGVKVSDGTYFYVIYATGVMGEDLSRKGTITVLGSGMGGNQ